MEVSAHDGMNSANDDLVSVIVLAESIWTLIQKADEWREAVEKFDKANDGRPRASEAERNALYDRQDEWKADVLKAVAEVTEALMGTDVFVRQTKGTRRGQWSSELSEVLQGFRVSMFQKGHEFTKTGDCQACLKCLHEEQRWLRTVDVSAFDANPAESQFIADRKGSALEYPAEEALADLSETVVATGARVPPEASPDKVDGIGPRDNSLGVTHRGETPSPLVAGVGQTGNTAKLRQKHLAGGKVTQPDTEGAFGHQDDFRSTIEDMAVGIPAGAQATQEHGKAQPAENRQLSHRAAKVWADFQDAIAKGTFNDSPPKDREVYNWLLILRQKGEDLPKFLTWQRYLREARRFYGCQKNTPRGGRATGRSIDTETGAKPINASARERRIKRSIDQTD